MGMVDDDKIFLVSNDEVNTSEEYYISAIDALATTKDLLSTDFDNSNYWNQFISKSTLYDASIALGSLYSASRAFKSYKPSWNSLLSQDSLEDFLWDGPIEFNRKTDNQELLNETLRDYHFNHDPHLLSIISTLWGMVKRERLDALYNLIKNVRSIFLVVLRRLFYFFKLNKRDGYKRLIQLMLKLLDDEPDSNYSLITVSQKLNNNFFNRFKYEKSKVFNKAYK
jgi:hypothetical protein